VKYLTDFFLPALASLASTLFAAWCAYSLGVTEGAHREHTRAVFREAAMLDRDACTRERQQINAWCREELDTQRALFSHVICPAGADAEHPRGRR
jgi:hypothetical protein